MTGIGVGFDVAEFQELSTVFVGTFHWNIEFPWETRRNVPIVSHWPPSRYFHRFSLQLRGQIENSVARAFRRIVGLELDAVAISLNWK